LHCRYLTFFWPEAGNCVIFDDSNSVLDDLYAFIEEALDVGESVLVHSTDGQSRACFCAAVYFMLKYKWTLQKTLEFLQNKRPDLMPRPGFMRQLQALDASLQRVIKAGMAGASKGGNSNSEAGMRRYTDWDPNLLSELMLIWVITNASL
jgi:Dual specificity phosphatase, catalytic domain